ncbi:2-thiouracil desulfurase family protein [Methanosarcina sp. UBA411]|jgi:predicted secreted protein|uniref:2-thiouracil desulfurase family protein n=1 Tax=Methanosarcina sp. UBA411 TaxID=1915589 RepID=UPI0025FE8C0D|nr:2-thiouracil desulfurase family protein [Methanosarcina sp. UBA411]
MKKLETYECFQVPEKPSAGDDKHEVLVISHCLLNPLVRVKGVKPVQPIDTQGANVIQLPCPEAMFFGMSRREITKDQLDHPAYRRFCREIFTHFADLLEDLAANGVKIKILGVPKSPSCGVDITSIGGEPGKVKEFHHRHAPGPGVFMEEVIKELKKRNVKFEIEDAGK